ncbi:DUF2147 domain-containing protein [Paraburkholderia terrae]
MHFTKNKWKFIGLPFAMSLAISNVAFAGEADAARLAVRGLWLTAEHDAVVEFGPCTDNGDALCGVIAWDQDANPSGKRASCGVRIAQLAHFSDGEWRDGWAFDPRTGKHYETVLRVTGDKMTMRSYVGIQLFGETENLSRVDRLPAGCPLAHSN